MVEYIFKYMEEAERSIAKLKRDVRIQRRMIFIANIELCMICFLLLKCIEENNKINAEETENEEGV